MTGTDNRSHFILVANDDSAGARTAAGAAIRIARSQAQAIRGLYVVDEALALDTYADYHSELPFFQKSLSRENREPTSRAELLTWLEAQGEVALQWLEARCADSGVPVNTTVLAGGVTELILKETSHVSLLAMGRSGHSHHGNNDALGHHFLKIAHHSRVPILAGGQTERPLNRLLLAYHGKAHADDALAWAARLQRDLPAELLVLKVRENATSDSDAGKLEEEEIDVRLVKGNLHEYRLLKALGQPPSEIAAAAAANDVDLIIVGGYRHSALVEWLVGSTVDRLLRMTSLPVLIA